MESVSKTAQKRNSGLCDTADSVHGSEKQMVSNQDREVSPLAP